MITLNTGIFFLPWITTSPEAGSQKDSLRHAHEKCIEVARVHASLPCRFSSALVHTPLAD